MKFVAISDTHNQHNDIEIPECDVLIHAGDSTNRGTKDELINFAKWLNEQDAGHIIMVPGNHELWLEENWEEGVDLIKQHCPAIYILNDSGVELEGVKFWGSPVTPYYGDYAWNRARTENMVLWHGPHIKQHWDQIPLDTDVLITHGPPYMVLDDVGLMHGGHQGCRDLLNRVELVKPDWHFFGHIHEGHGFQKVKDTNFCNVAICNGWHNAEHKPTLGFFV